ncbi:MAG TPA: 30S ribosomal protein S8 [Flavilitoribacter sp.]|nr:30S ribosomal protein S8 [Flavilitoribacter sp.]HMQ88010.1 30S ribosomal protein S8 [Flavilitoribacter sp.]
MAVTDPIADYLTRIRNAQSAGHRIVEIPASKLKKRITEILYDQGFILKYKFDDEVGKGTQGTIKIALKYDPLTRKPVIRELGRISKPGLRNYSKATDLPRIINGLGVAIVSTSRGVMTDKQARAMNVGGEVLCYVY